MNTLDRQDIPVLPLKTNVSHLLNWNSLSAFFLLLKNPLMYEIMLIPFPLFACALVLQPYLAARAAVGAGLLHYTNGWHVSITFYSKDSHHIRDGGNPPRAGLRFLV